MTEARSRVVDRIAGRGIRRLLPVLITVLVVASVALVLANFRLAYWAGFAALAGAVFTPAVPPRRRIAPALAVLLILILLAILLGACSSSSQRSAPRAEWPVQYETTVQLGADGEHWAVTEDVLIDGQTARQLVEGNGTYKVTLPPADKNGNVYARAFRILAHSFASSHWNWVAVVGGDSARYERKLPAVVHNIPWVPFTREHSVSVYEAHLPLSAIGVAHSRTSQQATVAYLVPDATSTITVMAPADVVDSTSPAMSASTVPGGQEFSATTSSTTISLATLSIVARHAPLRQLATLSLTQYASWLIAASWLAIAGFAQRRLSGGLDALWATIRHRTRVPDDATPARSPAKKPTTTRHTGSAIKPRRGRR